MTKRTCLISECSNGLYARGWCRAHYERWYKYGDPSAPVGRYFSSEESFIARTERQGDCLVWTGSKDAWGYGYIVVRRKSVSAHRYAWERENGPIPGNMHVDHICFNTSCVKVSHLRLVSRSENMQNRSGANSNSSTGVRNVSMHQGRFRVALIKDHKKHSFGVYDTIEEAAAVAEQARKELFGEFAGRG